MLGTSDPTNVKWVATISRRIAPSAGTTAKAAAKTARIFVTRGARIGSNIAKTSGITALIGQRKFGTMRGIFTMIFSTTSGGVIGAGEHIGPATILLTRGGGGAMQVGIH